MEQAADPIIGRRLRPRVQVRPPSIGRCLRPAPPPLVPLELAKIFRPRLDHPNEGEADRGGNADSDRRALAHQFASVVVELVDILVADRFGEAANSFGCTVGILAIFGAELVVDRCGGVRHHLGDAVEQGGRPVLAVDRIGAGPFGRLLAKRLGGVLELALEAGEGT